MSNLYILNEVYTDGFYFNLLNIISLISVFCGISVIVSKNPVVSVLFLIGLFASIASYLMMLGLNFIGLSYLLVYVGAVSILFLFILMLINVRISELTTDNNNSLFLAFIIGTIISISIYTKGSMFNSISFSLFLPLTGKEKEGTELSIPFFLKGKGMSEELEVNIDSPSTLDKGGLIDDVIQSVNSIYYSDTNNIYFATSKIWDSALSETSHITSLGNILYTSYPLWLILTSIILLLAMVGAIIITIKQ